MVVDLLLMSRLLAFTTSSPWNLKSLRTSRTAQGLVLRILAILPLMTSTLHECHFRFFWYVVIEICINSSIDGLPREASCPQRGEPKADAILKI